MSDMKDKLRRRKPRQVTIDGDVFYVRSMTIAEADHVDTLSSDPTRIPEILGYSLTRCLVDEAGANVLDPETADADGKTVFDPVIQEIPIETAMFLSQEIRNATQPQTVDGAKKTSRESHKTILDEAGIVGESAVEMERPSPRTDPTRTYGTDCIFVNRTVGRSPCGHPASSDDFIDRRGHQRRKGGLRKAHKLHGCGNRGRVASRWQRVAECGSGVNGSNVSGAIK